MASEQDRWSQARGGAPRPADGAAGGRTPDDLLRRAWAIRRLLEDTAVDDHAARIRLTAARDVVHHEAAQEWRARGWRPITEPAMPPLSGRSLLVAPVLAALVGAWLSTTWLGGSPGTLTLLVLLAGAPFLAELLEQAQRRIRVLALTAAVATGLYVVTGAMPATLVLLPAAALLLAIALAGTGPRLEQAPPDHP